MADGKGSRWNNHFHVPKHLVKINDEQLIARTVRLLQETGKCEEIIVTSHDPRYEFEGSIRYEPLNNIYEIDRFTEELIMSDMCFLYGDTFYTENTIAEIVSADTDSIKFFGNQQSIVAIKVKDHQIFKKHVDNVKELYLSGKIKKCVGWQVYRSFTEQGYENPVIFDENFVFVDGDTKDIDTPYDYELIGK